MIPKLKHPMQHLLEDLLAKAAETRDEKGEPVQAVAMQLSFIGNTVAGAVRNGPVPGTFMLLTPGKDTEGKSVMVARMFCAESLLYADMVVSSSPIVQTVQ